MHEESALNEGEWLTEAYCCILCYDYRSDVGVLVIVAKDLGLLHLAFILFLVFLLPLDHLLLLDDLL